MFVLNKKNPCLCGSGKKYKYCCFPYINSTETDFKEQMNLQNYKMAYKYKRAMLTKYLVGVKRHTEPFLKNNMSGANGLLKIDIEAISEYIDQLLFVAEKGSLSTDIPSSLSSISHLLINELWTQRINYYIALYYSCHGKNELAKQAIANYSIDDLADVKLMQIYYQLQSENMGIGQSGKLISKIVDTEKAPIIKLKYRFTLALRYFFNNDRLTALELANDVIETLDAPDTDIVPNKIYDFFVLSDIYSFFAQMTNDYTHMDKAINYLLKIKDNSELSPEGKAFTRTQIGYNYFILHNYDLAVDFLLDAHSYVITPISMIYLADTYLEKGDEQAARKILYEFSVEDVNDDLLDYLKVISKFLLKYPDYEKFREIHTILKNIDLNVYPYFNLMIKDFLLQLTELYSDPNIEDHQIRWKWLEILNKSLILQPNVFGFGVNINEIINEINTKH